VVTHTTTAERGTNLTRRQRQVLRLQAYGLTYQEISDKLGLSIWTVKNHHKQAIRALQDALGGTSHTPIRTALACYILGLIDGGLNPTDIARHLRQVQKQARGETDPLAAQPVPDGEPERAIDSYAA